MEKQPYKIVVDWDSGVNGSLDLGHLGRLTSGKVPRTKKSHDRGLLRDNDGLP